MHTDYFINELHQIFALSIAALVFLGPVALVWMIIRLYTKSRRNRIAPYQPPQEWGHGYVSQGEYTRSAFGTPWKDVDRNGRDTRNDILARDLHNVVFSANQNVRSGTLVCPYTDATITYFAGAKNAIEIDHVVPLSLAWEAGAKHWSLEMREQFANDPMNLLAVSATANRSKGNSGPATWLPANPAFQYEYMRMFEMVAREYGLVLPASHQSVLDYTLHSSSSMPSPVGSDYEHLRFSGLAA